MTGVSWRPPPPPAPAGWASAAPAGRWGGGGAAERLGGEGGRGGWGEETAPGQGHGQPGAVAGRAFVRRPPAGWQMAPGQ